MTCSIAGSPVTSATAGASFGDLTASVTLTGSSGVTGTATADASYDQLLLLPGTGSANIVGRYIVEYDAAGALYPGPIGSINQAGSTFQITQSIGSFSPPPLSEPYPFTIQLGVPFDVSAKLHFFNSLPEPGGSYLFAHLKLVGFTDANGNAVTPQLVTPEPQFAPLLAVILMCGGIFYRRKLRACRPTPAERHIAGGV